jgi:Ca-activated chloride channel family protein
MVRSHSGPGRLLLTGAAVVALLTTVASQQPPTFRSTQTVVPLFVTVTDAQQRLVTDLDRGDFEVYDNDKLQPLVVFENVPQPISVAVMLDTSLSMTGNLALLRQSAEQFFIRLFPKDQAKVGAFADRITVSRDFSSDRDVLISEVKNLDFGNSTRLFDGIAEGLDALKTADGRRVILVFTDGDDTSSSISFGTLLDRVRGEEAMVYAIGLESDFFNGATHVRTKPDGGLKKLAEETGGGYFQLEKTTALGPTFTRVAQELHSQYTLGFTPTALDNKSHKLAVKVKVPGMTVRARRSYIARDRNDPESR